MWIGACAPEKEGGGRKGWGAIHASTSSGTVRCLSDRSMPDDATRTLPPSPLRLHPADVVSTVVDGLSMARRLVTGHGTSDGGAWTAWDTHRCRERERHLEGHHSA